MRDGWGRGGRSLLLPAVALVGLVVVLAAAALGPVQIRADNPLARLLGDPPPVAQQETTVEEQLPDDQDTTSELPAFPVPLDLVVGVLAVSLALALLTRSLLTAERDPRDQEPDEDADGLSGTDVTAVADAARRGLAQLDVTTDGDTRDAVVACWVELERAAVPASGGRLPADSPTEFAERLLAVAPAVDPSALRRLRELYATARFGSHPTRRTEAVEAAAALRSLISGIERR